ncbi:MAG: Flp family type IVb pilin [Paraburkholderia sp.]|uniref:Flp family type IVb pilin n=1 Tax=Paraburkholderia sp. TaxID=1926495 RepID=UPI003C583C7E
MKSTIQQFLRDEEGAAAIEYGLLAGLISVMIILGATAIGTHLSAIFDSISTALGTAAGTVNTATGG